MSSFVNISSLCGMILILIEKRSKQEKRLGYSKYI
nr:MAG TPA: hypothetical protein [Caudoviricetes sp.]